MPRTIVCGILLCGLAALAGACGSNSTPTTPTPTLVTETFSGSIALNGAVTQPFSTSTAGTVTATLTSVTPDTTVAIGFSVGTWNPTTSVCQIVMANDAALQGAVLTGAASTAGTYCLRMHDPGTGALTADNTPISYTVTVSHP